MRSIRRLFRLMIFCSLLFPRLVQSNELIPPLPAPPLGEQWFGIYTGEERVGFVHNVIGAVPQGYRVTSDSSTKLAVLGFSRESFSREDYLVNRDLSLRSFAVEEGVDGKQARLNGEVTAKGLKLTVESGGGRQEKTLKSRGKIYPGPLLNLYPLMQGVAKGREYRLQMLDVEDVKLKQVTITAIGPEQLPQEGKALHLRNNLYRLVDNDIWVDPLGHTLQESVRDGLVLTRAEAADAAGTSLVEAAIAKTGWIVNFSLIELDKRIARPENLKRMVVELHGLPDGIPIFSGERQRAVRRDDGSILFTVGSFNGAGTGESPPDLAGTVAPDEQMVAVATGIMAGEKDPVKIMGKLAEWVAATVADNSTEDHSPLDTLKTKRGNCQSHVRLYAALAGAAGFPTRIVTGLVYREGRGFLYHRWAESFAGGWVAVDPTLGQASADATHIKLAGPEATLLAPVIGHVKASLVEATH